MFGSTKELTWGIRATNPVIGNSDAEGETNDEILRSLRDAFAPDGNPACLSQLTTIPVAMMIVEAAVLFSNTYGPKVSRRGELWSLCPRANPIVRKT